MNNDINYTKTFSFGEDQPPEGMTWAQVVERNRLENIQKILAFPAVLGRNYVDYMIEADLSVDPPVYKWKQEIVSQLTPYLSSETHTILRKKYEVEKARGPVRPITRHTSS